MVPSAPTDWLTAQTERRRLGQGGRKREEKETGMERNRLMEGRNGLLESASFYYFDSG